MPKFPKNTSSAMKKSGPFKMKSPFKKPKNTKWKKNKPGSGVLTPTALSRGVLDGPVTLEDKLNLQGIRNLSKVKTGKKGILD